MLIKIESAASHDDAPEPIHPLDDMVIYIATDEGFDIPFNKNPRIGVTFNPQDITTTTVEKKLGGLRKIIHKDTPEFYVYMVRSTQINPVVELGVPVHYSSSKERVIDPKKLDIQISYQFRINKPEDFSRIMRMIEQNYLTGSHHGYPFHAISNYTMIAPTINNIKIASNRLHSHSHPS